jgi:hypothetical protein
MLSMINRWRMRRKVRKISKKLTKVTNDILSVKGMLKTERLSKTNKSLNWSDYVAMRDTHINTLITDILRKESK